VRTRLICSLPATGTCQGLRLSSGSLVRDSIPFPYGRDQYPCGPCSLSQHGQGARAVPDDLKRPSPVVDSSEVSCNGVVIRPRRALCLKRYERQREWTWQLMRKSEPLTSSPHPSRVPPPSRSTSTLQVTKKYTSDIECSMQVITRQKRRHCEATGLINSSS
jgi:hypothetical protein